MGNDRYEGFIPDMVNIIAKVRGKLLVCIAHSKDSPIQRDPANCGGRQLRRV